jgi:tripartite-type tricarboxylate transporter receptor subunit TctC
MLSLHGHVMRILIRSAVMLFLAAASVATAAAQDKFPNRRITIIIPFSPGGGVDGLLRTYADVMSKDIGQTVLIQNTPGGGGLVAGSEVLRAGADGYTLYLTWPSTHSAMQYLQDMPFDPTKDFRAVSMLFYFQNVLVVPNGSAAKSLAELAEYGKTKPGGLVYGTPGNGSAAHILAAMVGEKLGIEATATQFRNGPDLNRSLVRGDLDYAFGTYQGMNEFVTAGQARVLAVVGDEKGRSPGFPDAPTFDEAGYPGLDGLLGWFGVVAPAATPDDVVEYLAEAFKRASTDRRVIDFVEKASFVSSVNGPEAFDKVIADDSKRYGEVIPNLEIQAQ